MMSLSQLYHDDATCDIVISSVSFHAHVLYKIEQLQNGAAEFKISEPCAKIFKKWVYERDILPSDLTLEIGIEARDISVILDIPKFYRNIKNQLFVYVLETKDSNIQFEYFKHFSIIDSRFNITQEQVASLDYDSYQRAICMQTGFLCEKDEAKAFKIYETQWLQHNNHDALNRYAYCLKYGIGCDSNVIQALKLFKLNWTKNKHDMSLHNYAYSFETGEGCKMNKTMAYELYRFNWTENKNTSSYYALALCLYIGVGCKSDRKQALKIYKACWTQHRIADALLLYAVYLFTVIDKAKAMRLLRMNAIINNHDESAVRYVEFVRQGYYVCDRTNYENMTYADIKI